MKEPHKAPFIYGTAWKRDQTAIIVSEALRNGFVCFDTAGQPKHYREELVGEAIREASSQGIIKNRSDINIQTKFSRPSAQDPLNAPYSFDASLEEQVHTSIKSSLHNLRHENGDEESSYLDVLLLHSPYPEFEDTLKAWKVFSSYVPHRTRALGISNVRLSILEQLYNAVDIKPEHVQVRFHPESQFEVAMRRFCVEKGISFQAHKVLKGNAALLESEVIMSVASAVGVSKHVALYLCILGLRGVRVVNGTKNEVHMREDLDGAEKFEQWIENAGSQKMWKEYMAYFRVLIGDLQDPLS